jgi:putative tryptophan/tyrosine transport system substrate-binding protein
MRRREFIALVGCAAATWPLAARAKDRLLGVLMSTTEDNAEGQANFTALRQGLQEFGWTEDQNIRIDCRWGGGDVERTRAYAAALVGLSPGVVLAYANAQLAPLSRETQTIRIVFIGASGGRSDELLPVAYLPAQAERAPFVLVGEGGAAR